MNFTVGQTIYWQGFLTCNTGVPNLYKGVIEKVLAHSLHVFLDYQIGTRKGKLRLFYQDPRGSNQSFFRKPRTLIVQKNSFATEEDLKAQVYKQFGVTFEQLEAAGANGLVPSAFGGGLPKLPRNATAETIIAIINASNFRYKNGQIVSNEAIAMALSDRPENHHLTWQLEETKRYFRGFPVEAIAA